jgi:fluoroacetyl-CoA thioesterase
VAEIGEKGEASITVTHADTASAVALSSQDTFPAVLATARMIALMEVAAARVLTPMLKDGELSVGVIVNIKHTAATPVGATAKAVATYLGVEGKLHRFRVEAFDDAGPIGEGDHARAIIATERLMTGAARRKV